MTKWIVLFLLTWITAASAQPWVSAYYLASNQEKGPLTADKVDFTAFSHLIHFGVFVNGDGSISPLRCITPAESKEVVTLAHAAGRKVLFCLGTDEGSVRLRRALEEDVRPHLIQSLVDFLQSRGYDGIDIDMEPLEDRDVATYEKFMHELRRALHPGQLLTAAVASEPELFARLQDDMDQINLMTYDLSGAYPGFRSWYNASLYGSGDEVMEDGSEYPSVDQMVQQFIAAGVARSKLGIGTAFYGYVWTGVSGPRQSIEGVKVDDGVHYNTIMDQYYDPSRYHWDGVAQAPWLGIDGPEKKFISYDDEALCARKQAYIHDQGLGGTIIWELGCGYRDSQPPGHKDALLQAVKQAWNRYTSPAP